MRPPPRPAATPFQFPQASFRTKARLLPGALSRDGLVISEHIHRSPHTVPATLFSHTVCVCTCPCEITHTRI